MAKRAIKLNPVVRLLIAIALVYVAGNMLITGIKLQVQIKEKKSELSEVEGKITVQQTKNEELNNILNAKVDKEYIEKVARESLGYGTEGERVYDNITDE